MLHHLRYYNTDYPIYAFYMDLLLCQLYWHSFGFLSRYLVLGIIIPTDLLMSLIWTYYYAYYVVSCYVTFSSFFMSLSWFIRMPLFWQANRLSMEKPRLFLTFIPAVQRKSVHFCSFSPFLSSFNPLSSRGWVFYFTLQRISMKMWKRKRVKKIYASDTRTVLWLF